MRSMRGNVTGFCAGIRDFSMVRPKKSLGQHFLRDENIARKIVDYINPAYPVVLEIGPGTGVLSKYLLSEPALDPWFMEIDRESVAYLTANYPAIGGKLIYADFLEYDLDDFPPGAGGTGSFTIIGNFPYNISSQILFHVLDYRSRIPEVIGMFQKEVAERIASPPGSKRSGIMSILLQAFYDIDYLFTVNETVFYPPPKVKSAVIRLRRNQRESLSCDESWFITIVKTAFNQRRKTMRNSLRQLLPAEIPSELAEILSERPEQLSVSDFEGLALATRKLKS
jgi:16S rRNA (adenine1518-N6/adenine1519-N6)-dimethyltransferase